MRFVLLFAVTVAAAAFSACDSGDAIDSPTPADVAGVYAFEVFRFQPTSTALAGVSVLDTLVAAESFIELLDSGQATLRFRREGGTTRFVPADFDVRRDQVRLTFQGGNEATLGRLVLPGVLVFDRGDNGALTLSETFTANLEAYDATRYGGFTAIPGTLTLRVRTATP